ncbi:endonuclease domain-containing protein [Streptomyces pacificus]|uniref:endonuclease domain-containing protein n=1 Tax=Streptomyces pacificus TaxID=2705029 RepID=UPI00280B9FE1|nr:endonuclease domain-containing protein [Streptomyces pacificus]
MSWRKTQRTSSGALCKRAASRHMSTRGIERKCSTCQKVLPASAFASDEPGPDGPRTACRGCAAEHCRRRRAVQGGSVRVEGRRPCRGQAVPDLRPGGPRRRASRRDASDGLSMRSRACRAARAARVVKGRQGHLERRYGITGAGRDAMLPLRPDIRVIGPSVPLAHVDHRHGTGRIRGVPCFNCNSAIGKLGDDPDTVRRAAAYSEGTSWKPTLVAPGVCRLPS